MKSSLTRPTAIATAIAGVSLLLGVLFDQLFFGQIPGISVLVFIVAVLFGLQALAVSLKQRGLTRSARWLLVPLLLFAAMVAVRANGFLAFLNIMTCLLLLLLLARTSFHDDLKRFNLLDYAKIPFLPLKFLSPLRATVADLLAFRTAAKTPLAGQLLRGALISLPILALFLVLFASADLIFQQYVTGLVHFHLSTLQVAQIALVAFVAIAFSGAFAYIFRPAESKVSDTGIEPAPSQFRIGQVESLVLLGSVNTLFFLFILIQLAYLFGGLSNISVHGFTYAEYARRGFFELLAVALVAFVMLLVMDKTTAKKAHGHVLAFRILSSLLIVQVGLVMVSAFKRLYLYEQAFGFTTLRLYSHIFVIFLAVIFTLLLVKILKNQSDHRFALPAFITALVFLAGVNALNPDAFIAGQNLDRFHQTGKLDASYMAGLSADAVPQIRQAIGDTTGTTRQQLVNSLNKRSVPTDWQSWNLARSQSGEK